MLFRPEPEKKTKMLVLDSHELLGHISSKSTIEIAKDLGWNLFDDGSKCESCATGKGHLKNVGERSNHMVVKKVWF
jgi:hypothetical protein